MLTNAGWLTSARLGGDLLQFFQFVIFSRYFGPDGIGQYALGLAITGFVYASISLGLEDYAIRECARCPADRRGSFIGKLLAIQLLFIALVSLFLIGLAWLTGPSPAKLTIVLLLSVQQFALALSRTFFSPAFAQERMVGPAVAELLGRISMVILSTGLVFFFHVSLPLALIPFPIGGLAVLFAAVVSARSYVQGVELHVSWSESRRILQEAWPFTATLFVFYLRARGSIILISLILGDAATGLFATSLKFLEVGIMPLHYLGVAAYPNLTRLFVKDKSQFMEASDRLLRLALIIGALAAWMLFFIVPNVVIPLLGEKFTASIPLVQSMALLALITPLATTLVRLLLSMHLQLKRLRISVFGICLNLVLTLLLLPFWGVQGAVAGWTMSMVITSVLFFQAVGEEVPASRLSRTFLSFSLIIIPIVFSCSFLLVLTGGFWVPAISSLLVFAALLFFSWFMPVAVVSK